MKITQECWASTVIFIGIFSQCANYIKGENFMAIFTTLSVVI